MWYPCVTVAQAQTHIADLQQLVSRRFTSNETAGEFWEAVIKKTRSFDYLHLVVHTSSEYTMQYTSLTR